jgi:hypothetical protein
MWEGEEVASTLTLPPHHDTQLKTHFLKVFSHEGCVTLHSNRSATCKVIR